MDIGEALATEWRHLRRHETPAARPATMAAAPAPARTKENRMSLLDTVKNGIAEAEAKLEGLDEDAINLVKRVKAHPETAVILNDLAVLASLVGIPQGFITGSAQALKVLAAAYSPDPAQSTQQAPQQPAA